MAFTDKVFWQLNYDGVKGDYVNIATFMLYVSVSVVAFLNGKMNDQVVIISWLVCLRCRTK